MIRMLGMSVPYSSGEGSGIQNSGVAAVLVSISILLIILVLLATSTCFVRLDRHTAVVGIIGLLD